MINNFLCFALNKRYYTRIITLDSTKRILHNCFEYTLINKINHI